MATLNAINSNEPMSVPVADVAAMTELLRETEQHHGEYEPTAPKHRWSGWYAAYIVARQNGKTPEEAAKEAKIHIEGAVRDSAA